MKYVKDVFVGVVLISISATYQQPALSQPVPKACEGDIIKFCNDVTPGNGHLISCIFAYEDQISEPCSQAIGEYGVAIDHLLTSARIALSICADDIREHCADTPIGYGRIFTCLKNNAARITDECRQATVLFSEAIEVQ